MPKAVAASRQKAPAALLVLVLCIKQQMLQFAL